MNTLHTLTLPIHTGPGTITPRPRRRYPLPWGGDKQTARGPTASGKPNSPDPPTAPPPQMANREWGCEDPIPHSAHSCAVLNCI